MRNTSCIWYVMSAQTSLFPTNRTVEFTVPTCFGYGPGIVVGIATGYALDGPGIESRWGEIFRTCPDRPWSPPSLLYNVYRVFPWGKVRPRRDPDHLPHSIAAVMEE